MNTSDESKPFRVLSLDGGGMRGLYTATLLQRLAARFSDEHKTPELDIGKGFDLIVGTSTGGILATGLTFGLSISKIIDLYRNVGPQIFQNPQPQGKAAFLIWAAKSFLKPANSAAQLRLALETLFGNTTVKELYDARNIGLCLTAVRMLDEKFRVFKTPHIPTKNLDNPYHLVDLCLATSAAPIFLPLAGIRSPLDPQVLESYADGGLAANNPVLIGLIEALQLAKPNQHIHILSVGTCSAPEGMLLSEKSLNRGLWHWKAGAKALTLSMNAQASSADFAAQFLAKSLSTDARQIRIVRFPEERRSEAHLKFLQMDLASPDALHAFATFGADDAVAAYRLCQDEIQNEHGKIIVEAFRSMPELTTPNQKELEL
jgi:patatin-like phospholipase/acyl hydrolase